MNAKYQKNDSLFSKELRQEVKHYFTENNLSKHGTLKLHVLSFGILALFLFLAVNVSLFTLNKTTYLVTCAIMASLTVPLILNIGHDSVHNTFFSNRSANKIAENIFTLLGTSPYFWKLRHIHSHHAYSNVVGLDKDVEQTNVIRLAEESEMKAQHKYQHLYMPLVFCFYSLNWFFYRDIRDLFTKQFGTRVVEKHPFAEWFRLIFAKALMLSYLVIFPYYLAGQSLGLVITGFLLFHLVTSILTTFALVSTHVGTSQEVLVQNENNLPYSFDEHQLRTTSDFATENQFLTWYFGGFNHHVTHHLFPGISHAHYPVITRILRKQCRKHSMPYHATSTIWHSISQHLQLLKKMSVAGH